MALQSLPGIELSSLKAHLRNCLEQFTPLAPGQSFVMYRIDAIFLLHNIIQYEEQSHTAITLGHHIQI